MLIFLKDRLGAVQPDASEVALIQAISALSEVPDTDASIALTDDRGWHLSITATDIHFENVQRGGRSFGCIITGSAREKAAIAGEFGRGNYAALFARDWLHHQDPPPALPPRATVGAGALPPEGGAAQ